MGRSLGGWIEIGNYVHGATFSYPLSPQFLSLGLDDGVDRSDAFISIISDHTSLFELYIN